MKQKQLLNLFVMLLVVSATAVAAVGCGDDDSEASNQSNGEVNNQEPNSQDPNGDDCPEGETVNPITGDCIPAANNQEPNNQGNNQEPGNQGNNQEPGNQGNNQEPGNQGNNQEEFDCGPGGLIGQTCRPDGGSIPGAKVTIEGFDCDGAPFAEETSADSGGYYDFSGIPAGDHTISIESGSFQATEDVTIVKDQVTDRESIGEKVCLTGDEVDIAVVTGVFDDIAGLLDGMEIEYDEYSSSNQGDLLGDLDALRDYEIVFAECSASLSASGFDADDLEFNMRRFVQEGGSLYASDWAHDFVQDAIPEAMLFADDVDTSLTSPRIGNGGDYPTVAVSDEMIDLFGTDPMEFDFTGGYAVVHSTNEPGGQVQFEATYTADYDGQVGDTTPAMITYDDPLGSGFVIFTEFHNSSQATGDVEDILEYMIFQL